MTITTIQWNMGGGKILKQGEDPALLSSYSVDGLGQIAQFLKDRQPDIITLQEVHRNAILNQAEYLANELGLEYVVSDFYADSHVEAGQELGQAIISRFPIKNHSFELFFNPRYQVVWEDGSVATSHDKGATHAEIEIDGRILQVVTAHMLPFRRFNVDIASKEAMEVLSDVQNKLKTIGTTLIQGDFNLDYEILAPLFSELFTDGLDEIRQTTPTTPDGRAYDHILFRDVKPIDSLADDKVLTDHYPIVSKFEL